MDVGLKVEGHRELVRGLRKADGDFPKHVRAANRKVANLVVSLARPLMAGRPGKAKATARTIRAGATANSAYVRLGGVPTAMGDEFGGDTHGRGNPTARGGYTTQFSAWRGNGPDAGYAVYPSIRSLARSGELEEAYEEGVDQAVKEAFPS